jgi:hypothetical protein
MIFWGMGFISVPTQGVFGALVLGGFNEVLELRRRSVSEPLDVERLEGAVGRKNRRAASPSCWAEASTSMTCPCWLTARYA